MATILLVAEQAHGNLKKATLNALAAAQQLAQKNGVPVVGVTETLPPTDKDFQDWQLRQINGITTALGG